MADENEISNRIWYMRDGMIFDHNKCRLRGVTFITCQ